MLDLTHLLYEHHSSMHREHKWNLKKKKQNIWTRCYHSRWFQPHSRSPASILHEDLHPRSGWSWKPSHWSPQRSNREVCERERMCEAAHITEQCYMLVLWEWMFQWLTWVQAVWSGCPVGWSGKWPDFLCGCRTGWAGLEHALMNSQSWPSQYMHPKFLWSPNDFQYS